MASDSARTLLSGLIDYAGLFPPASLDMAVAVRHYLSYAAGKEGWALGRFVAPAARLQELLKAAKGKPLNASAIVGPQLDEEIAMAQKAGVDTIEVKAATPAQIRSAAERLPEGITCYFEIPIAQDPRKIVEAIAEFGARAKVRTGGVTEDAIPGSRDVARFLEACVEANVPFKATAGLHHPVRSLHALTSDPDSPKAVMHGFLNLFLAAAFLRAGMERGQVVRLLEDQTADAFKFQAGSIQWRDESVDVDQIADARMNVGIAFGSCSFEDPIAELKTLGVL